MHARCQCPPRPGRAALPPEPGLACTCIACGATPAANACASPTAAWSPGLSPHASAAACHCLTGTGAVPLGADPLAQPQGFAFATLRQWKKQESMRRTMVATLRAQGKELEAQAMLKSALSFQPRFCQPPAMSAATVPPRPTSVPQKPGAGLGLETAPSAAFDLSSLLPGPSFPAGPPTPKFGAPDDGTALPSARDSASPVPPSAFAAGLAAGGIEDDDGTDEELDMSDTAGEGEGEGEGAELASGVEGGDAAAGAAGGEGDEGVAGPEPAPSISKLMATYKFQEVGAVL